MTKGKTEAHAPLHFRTYQEDDLWIGECVELGVSTSAETLEGVARGIVEATSLYIDTLSDKGELQRVFQERGLQVVPGDPPPPTVEDERALPVPAGAA